MLPIEIKERFLEEVAAEGNVSRACARLGLVRRTVYQWRENRQFAIEWDAALEQHRHSLSEELVTKAMAATGYIIEETKTDADGAPVLDDDFEPVRMQRLVGYDPQIFRTLLNKFVAGADPGDVTAVQVNVNNSLPPSPRLVLPESPPDRPNNPILEMENEHA